MQVSKIRCLISFIFTFLFIPLSYAVTIDKIIVFGDSMSDNGNIYALSGKFHKVLPAVPIIPKNPPYYEGRFSNGPIWIDHLAEAMNVPLADYAYGGSWSEPLQNSGQLIPFSLGMQINFYLVKGVFDRHKDNHLYVVWSGANDYLQGREDPEYATTNTVAYIEQQLESLVYHGGKHFLIPGLTDLSGVPEITQKGPAAVQNAKELSTLHNQKLFALIAKMQAKYPSVQFVTLDIAGNMVDLLEHPDRYNIKNTRDACYTGGFYFNPKIINQAEVEAAHQFNFDFMQNISLKTAYINSILAASRAGQECDEPEFYLYWDHVHPTRVLHHILAIFAVTVLNDNDVNGPPNAKRV